jgi:copper chaperone CopZ
MTQGAMGDGALQTATINVDGMNCGHCVDKVIGALQAVPGVSHVDVSLEGKRAVVRYDPAAATMGKLMGAVNGAGFKAVGFVRE